MKDLIEAAVSLEKYPLSQLISYFENESPMGLREQAEIIGQIKAEKGKGNIQATPAVLIGWTGMPGVGKSSLLHLICQNLLEKEKKTKIGILAIDPSSHISGGSLLGDRTRTRFPPKEKRIFFRSQPTDLVLGGLGKHTFSVTRLMREIFDVLFIETVGIGQNEIEIKLLSDQVILIMQPFAGDEIQFMKAGIMEIPDAFVINKCDEENLAQDSHLKLTNSLRLDQGHSDFTDSGKKEILPPVFLTSFLKQKGIDELSEYVLETTKNIQQNRKTKKDDQNQQNEYFLKKIIREKYGEYGLKIIQKSHENNKEGRAVDEIASLNYFTLVAKALDRIGNITKEELK